MVMISIDTETQGLNTQKFLMGTICDEQERVTTYYNKEHMWDQIMKLANKHRLNKKTLLVYAHNMHYDFLAIKPDELPRGFHTFCTYPYIVDVRDDNNRIYCKFLTTTSLWRGPLSEMGKALGYEKTETPEWLKQDNYTPTDQERQEAARYMEQDARIVMRYLKTLKEKLKNVGIRTRWLITAGQIGINHLQQQLLKGPNPTAFYGDEWRREFWMTNYSEEIHESMRGGRVEALKHGKWEHTSSIDLNSHYPSCLATMNIPDLKTEQKIIEPLTNGYTLSEVLENIGISNVSIEVKENNVGILPIRINDQETMWPNTTGQILIGTWTHKELGFALKHGYKIIHINWSIVWERTHNPFTNYIRELAKKRLETNDPMEHHFLKMLMNASIGKLAQRRPKEHIEWRHQRDHDTMIQNGFEAIEQSGYYRLYTKQIGMDYPRYYAPILYSLVTAHARIQLTKYMLSLPKGSVYYTDTDCIIADAQTIKNEKYKYNNTLGGFKLEHENEKLLIYGKKSYMIGENIKLSGVPKAFLNAIDFENGTITYKRMKTEKTTHDVREIGTFEEQKRDLLETLRESIEQQAWVKTQTLLTDAKTDSRAHVIAITQWINSKEHTQQEPS